MGWGGMMNRRWFFGMVAGAAVAVAAPDRARKKRRMREFARAWQAHIHQKHLQLHQKHLQLLEYWGLNEQAG